MDNELKRELRSDLFRHLDGIVTAPTAFTLYKKGVFAFIQSKGTVRLSELTQKFDANEGYLNVALHVIASQGWLEYDIIDGEHIEVSINERTEIACELIPLFEDVVRLIQLSEHFHKRKFEVEPFLVLESIFIKFKNRYGLFPSSDVLREETQNQILKHIEGLLIGPTIVAMGMGGMFHKYFMEASFRPEEFHSDADSFARLLDIFVHLEWFTYKNNTYRFTDRGMFFARRASAYGVTVSYIPTFRKLNDLIFGDPSIFWNLPAGSKEIHVDREMNVWGSGGAHSTYFRKIDEIIIDLFNQPIDLQPKGIVDMGCGNGAFLIHLFDVIEHRTLRGAMLEEHPLFLVGADYNKAALNVTRSNIIQADIWAKVIWGDIGRPDLLAGDLQDNYGIELKDLLNVRTFLDHNRIWSDPISKSTDTNSDSQGAFAFRGDRLKNKIVEENLKEHLLKWSPYVEKFGLLVIELHTIAPKLIAKNLGKTAATAYNATHGFSDQYIVEIDVFNKVAKQAGLMNVEKHNTHFPDSELGTVSINLLKRKTS